MQSPDFVDFMNAAKSLQPFVSEEADKSESLRRMSDDTVNAFKDAELYRLLLPKEVGGPELSPVEAMRVVEQIALADGSTGWCLMVGNIELATGAAYLPKKGVDTIFEERGKDLLIAGQGIPNGVARPERGGYRIEGNWSYGSGIHHADFIHTGCVLLGDDDQPVMTEYGFPEVMICHIDRKDIELKDNWNVIGLRGTGSFDYSARDVFVPEEMAFPFGTTEPQRGGHQYTIGLTGFTAWGHTSFALGVGRHALDEVAELARTKRNVFGLLGDGASFQERYARAESCYRAAREFCYSAWTDLSETLLREEVASLKQIALIRLAMCHLHEVVSDVCTFAHRAGGGVTLRPSVLQRCYRDIHAATQHVLLSDQIMQDTGKVLMGLAKPDSRWTILGLK